MDNTVKLIIIAVVALIIAAVIRYFAEVYKNYKKVRDKDLKFERYMKMVDSTGNPKYCGIKKCPVCGEDKANIMSYVNPLTGEKEHRMVCGYCGLSTTGHEVPEAAVYFWNMRDGIDTCKWVSDVKDVYLDILEEDE